MRKITALKRQKRTAERINVYLDNEFAFGLALDAATGLRIGQELSEAEIAALADEDTFYRAKNAALRLISYRPRSSTEIRRRLLRKEYAEPVIERVIAHLEAIELLDDKAFAQYWVEQRATFKPRSPWALRQELRQKGLSRQEIEAAVAEVDEEEMALKAAQKRAYRWADLPYEEYRQRMGDHLRRRGFRYEIAEKVIATTWQQIHT